MSRTYEEVRDEAMALTPEERGHLVEELLDSVESDEASSGTTSMRPKFSVAWPKSEAGTAKMVSAEEAIAAARRSSE